MLLFSLDMAQACPDSARWFHERQECGSATIRFRGSALEEPGLILSLEGLMGLYPQKSSGHIAVPRLKSVHVASVQAGSTTTRIVAAAGGARSGRRQHL